MTSRLNPYLTFNGNAREAMEFYQSVFGGDLRINTFGEFGSTDAAIADKVMHAMVVGGLVQDEVVDAEPVARERDEQRGAELNTRALRRRAERELER